MAPTKKLPYGKKVPLVIDFQGVPNGTPVLFEIWRKTREGENLVTHVRGAAAKDGKARAVWNPDFGEHSIKLKESGTGEKVEEKYYYIAKIPQREKPLEKRSGEELEFTFPLIVNLKDGEEPLKDVQYKITPLSDGKEMEGKFTGKPEIFLNIPLGEFKIEVDKYSPDTLYGVVKRGITTATGTVSREVSYNVKLLLNTEALPPPRQRALISLEKLEASGYEPVEDDDDLISIQTISLRVVFEDNTGDGNPGRSGGPSGVSRRRFYRSNRLVNFLNVLVPLRVEVRKFEGQSKDESPVGGDEVEAVFEVVDRREETGNIGGPRRGGRTGKGFVEDLIARTRAGVDDDNCIRGFATRPFHRRCRRLGDTVTAPDTLFRMRGRRLRPLPPDPSNGKRARMRIRAHAEGRKEGTANVFLRPPPILGDNYRLKITLNNTEGKPLLLRNVDMDVYVLYFQTPTITVWKKVKIHMVVCQVGVDHDIIDWNEVKNAYRDAFMEVVEAPEEAPEEAPTNRVFEIPMEEWMDYLNRFVYGPRNPWRRNWRRNHWRTYRRAENAVEHIVDFSEYSFPQEHAHILGSGRLVPPDDGRVNAWDVLGHLARRAVFDRLSPETCMHICTRARREVRGCTEARRNRCRRERRREWRRFRNPRIGRRIGLCVLLCRPPSDESTVGGRQEGGKLFYMVSASEDFASAGTFNHEMGHALFLEHGSTKYARATVNPAAIPLRADESYVVRSEEGGSEGPFFDDHYSEDMISCVMSYDNDYYDSEGNVLPNPVDWHFCGGCLIRLRFYDVRRMIRRASNESFRRLQYGRNPEIAFIERATVPGAPADEPIEHISFANNLNIKRGRRKRLLILYPKEGVTNDDGLDLYKDICFLSRSRTVGGRRRGTWISSNRTVATVRLRRRGDRWFSILRAHTLGNAAITFEIRYGPNAGDVVRSNPLNVTVVP